jgi:hypothetical protein
VALLLAVHVRDAAALPAVAETLEGAAGMETVLVGVVVVVEAVLAPPPQLTRIPKHPANMQPRNAINFGPWLNIMECLRTITRPDNMLVTAGTGNVARRPQWEQIEG